MVRHDDAEPVGEGGEVGPMQLRRRHHPTGAVVALLEDVDAMDRAAGSLLRRLDTGAEIEGRVRVTATPTLADLLLAGPLGVFAAAIRDARGLLERA